MKRQSRWVGEARDEFVDHRFVHAAGGPHEGLRAHVALTVAQQRAHGRRVVIERGETRAPARRFHHQGLASSIRPDA